MFQKSKIFEHANDKNYNSVGGSTWSINHNKYRWWHKELELLCSSFWQGKFSVMPSVFVTAAHHHAGLKRDAASVWIEDLTQSSFKVCLRELQNYAGSHEDVYVVSITLSCYMHFIYLHRSTWLFPFFGLFFFFVLFCLLYLLFFYLFFIKCSYFSKKS